MRPREGAPSPARSYYPLGLDPESGLESGPTGPPPDKSFSQKKYLHNIFVRAIMYSDEITSIHKRFKKG